MVDFQLILSEIRQLRAELRTTQRRLLPVEAAAAYLGISPKTIRNGLGPKATKPFPIKPVKVSGRVLFKKESLDAYIDGLGVSE
jgi:predicted DNA-binding transcriptional regulator AlpA